jgi:hypothetical protein
MDLLLENLNMRILTILNLQYHYQGTIKKQKLREGCGGRRLASLAAGTAPSEARGLPKRKRAHKFKTFWATHNNKNCVRDECGEAGTALNEA